jgi:RNA 2',3'-cyclic 3'-phosphodiesterase
MRLFIAMPFSQNTNNYLESLLGQLPKANMTLNYDFHVTLQFLGEASVEQAQVIMKELKKIKFKKFLISIGKVDVFKNNIGNIRIVYTDLSLPDELRKLQLQVEETMKILGFYPDKPFKPHITLARIKFANNKNFEEGIKKIKTQNTVEVLDKIVLFESILTPQGHEYNELITVQSDDA